MDYKRLIEVMKRFGSDETDICMHGLGITPSQIQENVVIAPWWEPSILPGLGKAEYIGESDYSAIKLWNIISGDVVITYIKTGIGAPVLMDALLSLGVTPCKKVLFIGSVGALSSEINIGDIVIPEYSISGDGASRYIASDSFKVSDVFGKKSFPDSDLLKLVQNSTKRICFQNNVKWHIGKTFSIDTIFAQYAHIDEILQMGCNVIEMETAAAFRAAKIANIPIAAIFSVSDNTISNKSLVSGRTEEEINYRKYVRRELFPKIILESLLIK
jgi:purine-nucleoside phosphorylase